MARVETGLGSQVSTKFDNDHGNFEFTAWSLQLDKHQKDLGKMLKLSIKLLDLLDFLSRRPYTVVESN